MLLMMVVVLALMLGSGGGFMGMMGHEKPVQQVEQQQETNLPSK